MSSTRSTISFGDTVRVRSEPETIALGLAGLSGTVYGVITPSKTGIEVIGILKTDYAVNVRVAEFGKTYWISPELLEFVSYAAGTEIAIGKNKLIRDETAA